MANNKDEFYGFHDYPDHLSGAAVLSRMLDGLGFRFYWATDELRPEDYDFRPALDVHSIGELTEHVWELMEWVSRGGLKRKAHKKPKTDEKAREQVLVLIHELREEMLGMGDEDLAKLKLAGKPFWHMINGPLSDALTHVGQINSFRRINGNPCGGANPFRGEPPKQK